MARKKRVFNGAKAVSTVYNNAKNFVQERYGGKKGMGQLARDVAFLKAIVNVEEKRMDSKLGATVNVNTPITSALNTLQQGTAQDERNGNSVKVIRIDANMEFKFSSGTTTNSVSQNFRYFLIRYLKTAGTSPTNPFPIADFLDQDAFSNYSILSLPNTNKAQNFQILAEGTVPLELGMTATTKQTVSKVVTFSVEKEFHQLYSGPGPTDLTDSLLVLVVVASSSANPGGESSITYSIRQWFVDN